jgi:hypothetical protein
MPPLTRMLRRRSKLSYMISDEGRAPRPKGGDPNVKMMRLALTPEEWRKLRVWAAEDDTSMQAIVAQVLRGELERKPRRGF